MPTGWIGDRESIEHYLSVVGADIRGNGEFKIYNGEKTVSFLGMGQEIVLNGDEEYSVKGHRCNLAAGMRSTSHGVGVMVF
jgi:hypothetical protein